LPYDRAQTTMRDWAMCARCRAEYENPLDRRFHAQPVACHQCGPSYVLEDGANSARGYPAIAAAAKILQNGGVVAVKGVGGYHLACDARNARSVETLRERKYRKERPFAVMVRDREAARELVQIDGEEEALVESTPRPIVLAKAKAALPGVAPENDEFGILLAYAPVHHLLFAAGAPKAMVMTSGNRSSEPIAYRDDDARRRLAGIADAFLVGEREVARRIDDSVARAGPAGRAILRHARGFAPQCIVALLAREPIVAVGADLKNAVALVVRGQTFVSQHVGDLEHFDAFESFKATIDDLSALYEILPQQAVIAHDAHPEYRSTSYAQQLGTRVEPVQHHRAHIASVLAEHLALETPALGFAFDGTGYGDDATIWGGEVFLGSVREGFDRVAHLRPARLAGGDAAALFPVQAAAGFLFGRIPLADEALERAPFNFPRRYRAACELIAKDVRVFGTTSMGRLCDTVAALLGFTREITFEAQAAMWLEYLARRSASVRPYPFPLCNGQLDYVPLLAAIVEDRLRDRDICEIARAFHGAVVEAILETCRFFEQERIVVSGGVFQNALLMRELRSSLGERLWTNGLVPCNDGGICLGQAAIAACRA
jgi:hydrogenase maturation protein HypF